MTTFILPDILLLLFPFAVVTLHLLFPKKRQLPFVFSVLFFGGVFILLNSLLVGGTQTFLSNWKIDSFGILMREVLVLGTLLALLFAKDYFDHPADGKPQLHQFPEFSAAIAAATFGGFIVVSADELLSLFLGLELATLPMYALTAWNKADPQGSEAGTKYILMGSVATAFELFGLSYLYGFSGSMRFDAIAQAVAESPMDPLLWISALFLFCGIGFKLTLFPFHTWAPDVYEGAPTPVTAALAVTSKTIAIAFVAVLVYGPLSAIHDALIPFLSVLAGVTILAGGLGALKQSRLRRFMAYSSISQAGYILVALIGPETTAKTALVFYLFLYAPSNYLAVFVFGLLGQTRPESFHSLPGRSKECPSLAVATAIAAFSLAGIPPLAGFVGKFFLFESAAHSHAYFIIAFACINNVIALYYYLQLVKSAWVDSPDENLAPIAINRRQKICVVLLTASVLLVGVLPFLSTNIQSVLGS